MNYSKHLNRMYGGYIAMARQNSRFLGNVFSLCPFSKAPFVDGSYLNKDAIEWQSVCGSTCNRHMVCDICVYGCGFVNASGSVCAIYTQSASFPCILYASSAHILSIRWASLVRRRRFATMLKSYMRDEKEAEAYRGYMCALLVVKKMVDESDRVWPTLTTYAATHSTPTTTHNLRRAFFRSLGSHNAGRPRAHHSLPRAAFA